MVRPHHWATSSAQLLSSLVVKLEGMSADIGRVAQTIGHADFWKLFRRTAEMVTKRPNTRQRDGYSTDMITPGDT
jgi:hypothetical protein